MKTTALNKVLKNLKDKEKKFNPAVKYYMPSAWIKVDEKFYPSAGTKKVNPYSFFIRHIEAILKYSAKSFILKKNWIKDSVIYNVLVRLSSAFDHNQDKKIGGDKKDLTLNSYRIRESGTFLKTIASLGHIKNLGSDTLYMLPITHIGVDGHKGDAGSPYAIKNQYQLEPSLKDPLTDTDVETEFKALVEACHILGIKVILEFVLRTGSKDSDWAKTHPEWFYWIDASIQDRGPEEKNPLKYGNPLFSKAELKKIKSQVKNKIFKNLPPPPEIYRNMFKLPPAGSTIYLNKSGQYIGGSKDILGLKKTNARIPGAFADWPPDDVQPPWTDVTYLRMYKDPNPKKPIFNYMAYNTIRMYDKRLARLKNANISLWNKIEQIIPFYQNKFDIDGVLIDMGHAMPPELMARIIKTAKSKKNNFAFLSENFSVDKSSAKQGYCAVVGYTLDVEHKINLLRKFFRKIKAKGFPIRFLASSENHNTPRAASRRGGLKFSKLSFVLNSLLPYGIVFIHSGFELGETYPVNTGINFKPAQIKKYKNKLPLFDLSCLKWDRNKNIIDFISKVSRVRKIFHNIICNDSKKSFSILKTKNSKIVGFWRKGGLGSNKVHPAPFRWKLNSSPQSLCGVKRCGINLLVVLNYDFKKSQKITLKDKKITGLKDLILQKNYTSRKGRVVLELKPGEAKVLLSS